MSDETLNTIKSKSLHDSWVKSFRGSEASQFYDLAFNYISGHLKNRSLQTVLDAGCGSASKTLRLASHGFKVTGCDFSEDALDMARKAVSDSPYPEIELQKEDLTAISFSDNAFDAVICWGVLMHIPDIHKAISELSRVVRPGGILVIGESNMHSLHSIVFRNLRSLLRPGFKQIYKTEGVETYITTPSGQLLVRQTDMNWLIGKMSDLNFTLSDRVAGQFTELYTSRFSTPLLNKFIHLFNNTWFKYIKSPKPSLGNILFFEKTK
ncbi:class I SAM-dependent methyltransferase [Myxococcota bacterium]|nr:class I SAM-dependent methyltransferase [Myxococcota bacterium]MBU1381420.1 class I SAM-dependent methyltransferase [Myxococcota bacterium]MBU1498897.1 class I SAM-dependent methyltransferase [Myxococcota bacterium]